MKKLSQSLFYWIYFSVITGMRFIVDGTERSQSLFYWIYFSVSSRNCLTCHSTFVSILVLLDIFPAFQPPLPPLKPSNTELLVIMGLIITYRLKKNSTSAVPLLALEGCLLCHPSFLVSKWESFY